MMAATTDAEPKFWGRILKLEFSALLGTNLAHGGGVGVFDYVLPEKTMKWLFERFKNHYRTIWRSKRSALNI